MGTARKREAQGFFAEADFRLLFQPDKISRIDDPAGVSRALHEELELKYFYEGSSTLLIGNEPVEVQAGDLVVINPYESHSTIRFGEEERGHYRFLMMDLDFFMDAATGGLDLRALMVEEGLILRTLIRGDARIADMMRRLTAAYTDKGAYWRLTVRGVMLELFALLLSEYSEKDPAGRRGDLGSLETVEPAIRRIREDYAEPITLDELAALCKVSKCHFCRAFRRVTGKSPMRYLLSYRLKIADLLLSGSGDSIATVAEKCGFGEQTYFSRCYKAHYGISPAHRRAARK